ncbi:TauD/TfdA family dioxygenase [Streptomyces sp. NPDC051658]|uniref:TauD/TfdA family dioxygenase n=1 Tax=Streptomyces sp. NPDC051658 TaxID=3365667 RepID=UPI00379CA2B9
MPLEERRFDIHADLALRLGLGAAYTPLLYRDAEVQSVVEQFDPYNDIPRDIANVKPHSEVAAQSFHVDGLLEPLGYLKTTMLQCRMQAATGGGTQIFLACRAFEDLIEADPQAAAALAHPLALTRFSTITPSTAKRLRDTGPSFGWVNGTLCTRFCDGPTEAWNLKLGADLERGLRFIRSAQESSEYVEQIHLKPGEVLIFRNDRVAHRGMKYSNGERSRHITRSMYLNAPTAVATK